MLNQELRDHPTPFPHVVPTTLKVPRPLSPRAVSPVVLGHRQAPVTGQRNPTRAWKIHWISSRTNPEELLHLIHLKHSSSHNKIIAQNLGVPNKAPLELFPACQRQQQALFLGRVSLITSSCQYTALATHRASDSSWSQQTPPKTSWGWERDPRKGGQCLADWGVSCLPFQRGEVPKGKKRVWHNWKKEPIVIY